MILILIGVLIVLASKKVDLVMWTKDGARFLPYVLNSINKAFPVGVVGNKFVVDDGSVDGTVEVAKEFGWIVVPNCGSGISNGANTALSLVNTDFFCSFEQDVLLCDGWWNNVSQLMVKGVLAVNGLRFLGEGNGCCGVEKYYSLAEPEYGRSLDNTLWNRDLLFNLGGFPYVKGGCCDSVLVRMAEMFGYGWVVDKSLVSVHLRDGFFGELKHWFSYGYGLRELMLSDNYYRSDVFLKFFKSFFASVKMFLRVKDYRLLYSYPLVRFFWLCGFLKACLDEF